MTSGTCSGGYCYESAACQAATTNANLTHVLIPTAGDTFSPGVGVTALTYGGRTDGAIEAALSGAGDVLNATIPENTGTTALVAGSPVTRVFVLLSFSEGSKSLFSDLKTGTNAVTSFSDVSDTKGMRLPQDRFCNAEDGANFFLAAATYTHESSLADVFVADVRENLLTTHGAAQTTAFWNTHYGSLRGGISSRGIFTRKSDSFFSDLLDVYLPTVEATIEFVDTDVDPDGISGRFLFQDPAELKIDTTASTNNANLAGLKTVDGAAGYFNLLTYIFSYSLYAAVAESVATTGGNVRDISAVAAPAAGDASTAQTMATTQKFLLKKIKFFELASIASSGPTNGNPHTETTHTNFFDLPWGLLRPDSVTGAATLTTFPVDSYEQSAKHSYHLSVGPISLLNYEQTSSLSSKAVNDTNGVVQTGEANFFDYDGDVDRVGGNLTFYAPANPWLSSLSEDYQVHYFVYLIDAAQETFLENFPASTDDTAGLSTVTQYDHTYECSDHDEPL